ncbi:zinc finger protein 318 [Anguilla rostrata]|uniref:zinc finger protein 318 n=1 Tax=Anguilla rostrata TaxID=7938 RepID=UPI0030CAA839
MFHGGGPGGRYPRQYEPRCRNPTSFDQPPGPSVATGFRPHGQYNLPSRPRVPYGPFEPHQYEGSRPAFPPFYLGNSEECRRSSAGRGYPASGCGSNQGPCGGPPGENVGRELNPCAGFPVVSMGNPHSQEDMENQRASEEFLRCLAAKEKFPVRDRAVDRGEPHYRPPCPGNGQGQEPGADDQACKRQSMGRSRSRPRSRSRGRSVGRSKSRPRSRPRSRSRGKSMGRSKSRPRSRSRSRSRSRGKSMGRSKCRPRSRSRSCSRGKSMGRSKSRPRSRSRSRGKSAGRSKSRPRSRSRSQEKSLAKSCSQGAGLGPSRSCSGSSSSSSSISITVEGTGRTAPPSKKSAMDMFRELLLAGQLKNREELLTLSKMAALKKQLDPASHGPASTQTSRYPAHASEGRQTGSLPRETQSLLSAVNKGMEPSLLASIQGQMGEQPHGQRVQAVREDVQTGQCANVFGSVKQETAEESVGEFLLPHERVRHDTGGFSRILGVMGNAPDLQEKRKIFTDIEDEEKFLYGDEDEKGKVAVRPVAGEKQQAAVDFEKIKKALTTIGLDLGKAEISKMVARTQEHQTSQVAESSHLLKGVSSSGGPSPSPNHGLKRNRSPNSDTYHNSHSSAKQAVYSGAPAGLVRSEFDTSAQEKQGAGEIPFFRPDSAQQPLLTANVQTSALGSEPAIWGRTPLKVANCWPQKQNAPAPRTPAGHYQIPGLGPLKEALESLNATTKGSGMDTLIDLANQSAYGRTSQRQKNSEENAKIREEALNEQMRRKDYLLKELESLLKREVSEFVVPVIGFCCQLCEEFFGDVASAQDHATCQSHKEKCKKHAKGRKSEGNLQVRPAVDTERREPRGSEHKWTSKEGSEGYRETGEQVLVKVEKLETSRRVRAVSGPSSATPSRTAERKDSVSSRSSWMDRDEDSSSKARKKKKKKKEKKRLKKEKKKEKKEREKKEKADRT